MCAAQPKEAGFADDIKGAWLAHGNWAGKPAFGFMTEQLFQTQLREVGFAHGDSVGEPAFGLHHRLSEDVV